MSRSRSNTNVVEYRSYKLVYRQYMGMLFIFCVDVNENELSIFEIINMFVEVCDLFFMFIFRLLIIILDVFVKLIWFIISMSFIIFWIQLYWQEKFPQHHMLPCYKKFEILTSYNKLNFIKYIYKHIIVYSLVFLLIFSNLCIVY